MQDDYAAALEEKRDRLVDVKDQGIAERGLSAVGRQTDAVLRAVPSPFQVLNTTVQMRCPQNTLALSLAIRVQQNPETRRVRLRIGQVEFGQLRSIASSAATSLVNLAVTPGGVAFDTTKMAAGDLYSLELEVPIRAHGLMEALVRRDATHESPKSTNSEYWMHAQIRYPDSLVRKYPGGFDLRDVEFPVDVGITEHIKTVIPQSFIQELKAGVDLLAERNPYSKTILGQRHVAAMRRRGHGNTMELLGNLQGLFFPDSFRKYVQVTDDFVYDSCERGVSFYDSLPFPTWPRAMKVVSRTQLGVNHWASDGILQYKREDFLKRVREVMGL